MKAPALTIAGELERASTVCSCDASIAFVRGEGGGSIPVELEPAADGDLELRLDGAELVGHVVREQRVHAEQLGLELDVEQRELGPRYRSHWARCPDAPAWRREL